MGNKTLKIFKKIILVITVFIIGLACGKYLQINKSLSIESKEKNQSTKIALVNQDLGTDYSDSYINYSDEIISSLGDSFIATSREAAKKGIENGQYGGMIIFSGKFSSNIITINNEKPEKAQIYYEINPNLSDNDESKVTSDILKFERNLNDKLSYLYIASILNEFHISQSNVSKVLKNDNEDLENIFAINDNNLMESINLSELEKLNIDIDSLDLTKDFEGNIEVMNEMDSRYGEYLGLSQEELDKLKSFSTKSISSDTGIIGFKNNINNVNMLPEFIKEDNSYSNIFYYLNNRLNSTTNNAFSFIKDKTENLSNKNNDGNIEITDNTKAIISENIETVKKDLDVNISKELEVISALESDLLNLSEIIDRYDLPIEGTEELKNITNNIDETIENINNTLNENAQDIKKYIESLKTENKITAYMLDEIIDEYKSILVLDELNKKEVIKSTLISGIDNAVSTEKLDLGNIQLSHNNVNWGNSSREYIDYLFAIPIPDNKSIFAYRSSFYDKLLNIPNIDLKTIGNTEDPYINLLKTNIVDEINNFSNSQKDNINEFKATLNDNIKSLKDKNSVLKNDLNNNITDKNNENTSNIEGLDIGTIESFNDMNDSITKNNTNFQHKIFDNLNIVNSIVLEKETEATNFSKNVVYETEVISKDNLHSNFDVFYSDLSYLELNLNEYNPMSNILKNNRVFQKLISDFDENNREIQSDFNNQDKKNIEFTKETYERADTHVSKLKEDLLKTKEASDNLISSGLKNLKTEKTENSYENNQTMYNFTKKLPFTKIGTVDNTYMYDFIASPLQSIETSEKRIASVSKEIKENTDINGLNSKKVTVLITVIAIFMIGIIKSIFFKRNNANDVVEENK